MQYEWKVIEWWFSQGYGAVQLERERMLNDGFEYVATARTDICHYNLYRKHITETAL